MAAPHSGTTFDLVHTAGCAVAVTGLGLLAARTRAAVLLAPVAAVGAVTLTLYSLHVALYGTSFLAGRPGLSWVVQTLVALVVAPLYLVRWRRGPLEEAVHLASEPARRALAPRRAPPGRDDGVPRTGRDGGSRPTVQG